MSNRSVTSKNMIKLGYIYIFTIIKVLDWLEKHGEVFLRKNVGIGKNLQKARAYQKSHETFEGVVQVRSIENPSIPKP